MSEGQRPDRRESEREREEEKEGQGSTCILIGAILCVDSDKKGAPAEAGVLGVQTKSEQELSKFWRQANESIRVRWRTEWRGLCVLFHSGGDEKY